MSLISDFNSIERFTLLFESFGSKTSSFCSDPEPGTLLDVDVDSGEEVVFDAEDEVVLDADEEAAFDAEETDVDEDTDVVARVAEESFFRGFFFQLSFWQLSPYQLQHLDA